MAKKIQCILLRNENVLQFNDSQSRPVTTHMLQNPTDSTELASASSFGPLAPSKENAPTTFTHTQRSEHLERRDGATFLCVSVFSDTHLARDGVDEFG